jgi:hypothetical protein
MLSTYLYLCDTYALYLVAVLVALCSCTIPVHHFQLEVCWDSREHPCDIKKHGFRFGSMTIQKTKLMTQNTNNHPSLAYRYLGGRASDFDVSWKTDSTKN